MNAVIQLLKNLRPFIKKGTTTFDEVMATFKDKFGRDPEGMEVIAIRKEFKDAGEGEKVLKFPSTKEDDVETLSDIKNFSPNMKRKSPKSGKTYQELLEEKYDIELRGTESMEQIKNMIKNIEANKELDEFATGGRVNLSVGGILKLLPKFLKKETKDLTEQTKQFREGPITYDFLNEVDKDVIEPFIRTRDTKGTGGYGMYDDFEELPAGLKAAELISRIKNSKGEIDYERAEMFIGKKLRGDESIDELFEMIVTPQRIEKAIGGKIGIASMFQEKR